MILNSYLAPIMEYFFFLAKGSHRTQDKAGVEKKILKPYYDRCFDGGQRNSNLRALSSE